MEKVTRVVFCTYPCLYSNIVFDELLRANNIEIVTVISSTRNLNVKENKLISDFKRVKVSGLRYSLYLLYITQGYKLLRYFSGNHSINNSIQSTCKKQGTPLISTSNINTSEVQEQLKALKPDVIFCAHFNQRIHPDTYGITDSAINLHPSLLPDLKGVDPAFYALADNYENTGVTIHKLEESFDTGEIISQGQQTIEANDSLVSINMKLFKQGAELFIHYLLDKNKRTCITSDSNESRYDSWPCKVDVKRFKKTRKFLF